MLILVGFFFFLIKYTSYTHKKKTPQIESHTSITESWCSVSYTLKKNLSTEIWVCLFGYPASQCACQTVPAFSFSGGCSAAPPDRRRHRPGQPGPRLSSLQPPTSFLQCLGDLERTQGDVTNRKEKTRKELWKKRELFLLDNSSDRLRPSSSSTCDTMASL